MSCTPYIFPIDYLQKYLDRRPDPADHEAYINEQMEAFEEVERRVQN